jgi:CheY-like chemotaxis protein
MKYRLQSVLVIDDDEPTNFLNQLIIEKSGYARHVKTVQSGQDALDYLENSCSGSQENSVPDLIFLDINMPAMNGWEFLEKYKTLDAEKRGKVMVVMLTTSLFPEDQLRAKEIPEVSCFENKPLTSEKLDKILNQFFNSFQN